MVKRRRHATREKVAELLVPFLDGLDERFPDGGAKNIDYARALLDALGEMGAPVDDLISIVVDEPVHIDRLRLPEGADVDDVARGLAWRSKASD